MEIALIALDVMYVIVGVIYFVLMLGYTGISIYLLVLFIKLAKRGIKALDIYIAKKVTVEEKNL